MIKIPSLKDLLAAGAHFGQRTSRWHPKMKPFLFGSTRGVHLINLEKTREQIASGAEFLLNITRRGGTVLFVGTKGQAQSIIEKEATRAMSPYVTVRWLGGLFTNFNTVLDLIRKLERLETDKKKGQLEKYTKREQLDVERQIRKLNDTVGGIRSLSKLPDAVFITDINVDDIAVKEAVKTGVPIVAIVDSNSNPTKIDYPIPANDDAVKTLELITKIMADAVIEGRQASPATAKSDPAAKPEAEKKRTSAEDKKLAEVAKKALSPKTAKKTTPKSTKK